MSDKFEECKYRKNWIKNFEKLVGRKIPPKDEFFEGNESLTDGEAWVNEAVQRFTNKPNRKNIKLIDLMPDDDVEINKKLQWKK